MNETLLKFAVFMSKVLVTKGIYPPPTCQAEAQAIVDDCIASFMASEGVTIKELTGNLQATSQAIVQIIMSPGSTAKN